ncbi:MAG: hypothetical protein AAF664_14380 [Planctomycetota bacterium]
MIVRREILNCSLAIAILIHLTGLAIAQATSEDEILSDRIEQLEGDVSGLQIEIGSVRNRLSEYKEEGSVAFIAAVVCALWAKNSGRNAWLWFFMGAFFWPVTVLVMLYKNGEDFEQKATT